MTPYSCNLLLFKPNFPTILCSYDSYMGSHNPTPGMTHAIVLIIQRILSFYSEMNMEPKEQLCWASTKR